MRRTPSLAAAPRLNLAALMATACVLTVLSSTTPSVTAQSEDIPFGLLARYTADTQTVERIDYGLSFDWGAAAPDERLRQGPFQATWTGLLLARLPGQHTLHARVTGNVTVAIDGRPVLQASGRGSFVSGQPFDITTGDHTLTVTYQSPEESDKPAAAMSLFWSSQHFTMEPIPADALSRDDFSDVDLQMKGRRMADALRCTACHRDSSGLEPLHAPALDHVRGSQPHAVLIQRLMRPRDVVPNSHMPSFGLTRKHAEQVAAFLYSVSKPSPPEQTISHDEQDVSKGQVLLLSRGCVACHRLSDGRHSSRSAPAFPYDGPDLRDVGRRRSASWLLRWLTEPRSINQDHRMPTASLTKEERRRVVAALTTATSASSGQVPAVDSKAAEAGRDLVVRAGCAACHRIPQISAVTATPMNELNSGLRRDNCLQPPPNLKDASNQNQKPGRLLARFDLQNDEASALKAWLQTIEHSGQLSVAEKGARYLDRNGCIACHDRNHRQGLSSLARSLQKRHPDLEGQSQALVPPPLTAVGDKLRDNYLHKVVAGETDERRLPWLLVQMPHFHFSAAERSAIVQHFVTTDRIPDAADEARAELLAHIDVTGTRRATTQELLLGNQLAGATGFNCVACHKAGPFEPRNVAPGTRGSDLMTMGQRIRPRFFQRWMRNPIRVVRGIEMPAIPKAVPGLLDENLPKQLGVLWTALSDPRFTPPTVTSRFEQVVRVLPGQNARVIRDVFTIGSGADRAAVARAFAVGFENGHNLLFDLDRMQLRQWTIGEFARQRTEGKSWFWDLPGTVVRADQQHPPQLVLQTGATKKVPFADEGRWAELVQYRQISQGVEFDIRWHFAPASFKDTYVEPDPHFTIPAWERLSDVLDVVVTRHRVTAVTTTESSPEFGWSHAVTVLTAPENSVLRFTPAFESPTAVNPHNIAVQVHHVPTMELTAGQTRTQKATVKERVPVRPVPQKNIIRSDAQQITTVPGFSGVRLPLDTSIMPTALAWRPDGRMALTSLKGHVWIAEDTDSDRLPDTLNLFEEGLAAPFGLVADGNELLVSHKPEIIRLQDTDNDGRADARQIVAAGWGYNDNYHDWTSGLTRDNEGNLYAGLGSDYAQKDRPKNQDRWRGGVIRVSPSGRITPLAMSMRYPMGLALNRRGQLFATDNQGVQNTFNEINHILPGRHYGVPSRHQPRKGLTHEPPAIMIPHPWTRSVNSILFLPDNFPIAAIRGHGIGCEYDLRFLIRFTLQEVDGVIQGASYAFSLNDQPAGDRNFVGPICCAVSPDGALCIGSIWDSGWQGGPNTGAIERLVAVPEEFPNGIREVRATPEGFDVSFFQPLPTDDVGKANNWLITGYTRVWGGSYATPDSGRYSSRPSAVTVMDNGRRILLQVSDLRPGYLYTLSATQTLADDHKLWPAEAHYSMKTVPLPAE